MTKEKTREPREVTPRVGDELPLFRQGLLTLEGFLPMWFSVGAMAVTLGFYYWRVIYEKTEQTNFVHK